MSYTKMQHRSNSFCVMSWMMVIVPEGHLDVILAEWRQNWVRLLKKKKKKDFTELCIHVGDAMWSACV